MKFLDAGKSIVPNTSKAIAHNKNKYNFISIQLTILHPSCRRVYGGGLRIPFRRPQSHSVKDFSIVHEEKYKSRSLSFF